MRQPADLTASHKISPTIVSIIIVQFYNSVKKVTFSNVCTRHCEIITVSLTIRPRYRTVAREGRRSWTKNK